MIRECVIRNLGILTDRPMATEEPITVSCMVHRTGKEKFQRNSRGRPLERVDTQATEFFYELYEHDVFT